MEVEDHWMMMIEGSREMSPEQHATGLRVILDAEQHKAAIAPPQGRPNLMIGENDQLSSGGQVGHNGVGPDDEFFHVTCHLDSGLQKRIEAGEFIELDKLLPRDAGLKSDDAKPLRIVERDGETLQLGPVLGVS